MSAPALQHAETAALRCTSQQSSRPSRSVETAEVPLRSDDRSCLARPTRTGPVTKKQLVKIRQNEQQRYNTVERAKAAAEKARVAATATPIDVTMRGESGFES
ncbi:hypothetical protein K3495_g14812 [Podosphaera aphanis]|nr:hypothetical protein K3495_g14812 [Podosphaera aphanis]